jgi:hypothetical protein
MRRMDRSRQVFWWADTNVRLWRKRDLRPGPLSRRYWRISGLIAEIAKPTLLNPDVGAKGAGPLLAVCTAALAAEMTNLCSAISFAGHPGGHVVNPRQEGSQNRGSIRPVISDHQIDGRRLAL